MSVTGFSGSHAGHDLSCAQGCLLDSLSVKRCQSSAEFYQKPPNSVVSGHPAPSDTCPGLWGVLTGPPRAGAGSWQPAPGLPSGRGCYGAVHWNNPQGLLQSASRCGVGGASTSSRRGQELCQEGTLFGADGLFLPPQSFIRVVCFPCGSVQRHTDLLSETNFRNNIGRLNLIFCNLGFFSNSKFLK